MRGYLRWVPAHDGLTSPEDDEQASEASPASLIFTALTKSAWAENPHPPQTNFACDLRFSAATWPHSGHLQRVQAIFEKVCRDFQAQLVEMNGQAEHVHLLINYPPKHSVSSLVNSLTGVSSRLLRSERPDLEKRYWNSVRWPPSYFAASCGGAPLGHS
jgi:REP-associated tyrosine transposase